MSTNRSDRLAHFDLAYTEVERRVDLQLDQIDGLDAKAGFLLGAASFLVSGIAVVQTWAGSQPEHSRAAAQAHGTVHWLALLMAALYLGVVFCSFMAYRLGDYDIAPGPADLKAVLAEEEKGAISYDVRDAILGALLEAFEGNSARVRKKVFWTKWALRVFIGESLCLAGVLVVVS